MKRIHEIQLQEKQVSLYANAQAPFFFNAERKAEIKFDNEAILNAKRTEKAQELRLKEAKEAKEEAPQRPWWICC